MSAAVDGYKVPGSGYTNYRPPWSHSSFYTNNTWWVLAEDSSRGDDVFLWKWDGGTPQNPGGAGNFSVIPGVEPADRSSGRQTIWWDEASQKLVALEMHHSTSQYHEFVYDAGSDTWSAVVKDESPPIRGSSSNSLTALVIDSAGVSWYIEYETTTPRAWYRGGPSNWVQGATIDVAGNGGSSNTAIAAFTFRDDDGDSAIGIVYTSVSGWKFAWRKDLAPRNAPWTVESVTNLYTPDDHLGAMAYLPAGEVASTIVFAGKSGADQAFVAKRSSSGAWSVSGALTSDFSKVNMVLDETNEQVYVLGENKDARTDRKYIKVDLADLSVAPAVTFMQDDGASNDFSGSVGTPTHPVNANTELMLVSRGPSGTWWNILDIAGVGTPVNQAPVVDAGTTATIILPVDTVNLDGMVTDDGLPAAILTTTWSMVSGPAAVFFDNPNAVDTLAAFPMPGIYVLRLTADDTARQSLDEVTIIVDAAPALTSIAVLPDNIIVALSGSQQYQAMGYDQNGNPFPIVPTFSAGGGIIDAGGLFAAGSVPGQYSVTATDGPISGTATVNVSVNQAPIVDVGSDLTLALPNDTVSIDGTVSDDGLPNATLSTEWSMVSGPAPVSFSAPNSADTNVTFPAPGTYVLRLRADDTGLQSADDVIVTVNPAPSLATILISPDPATLSINDAQQFVAEGLDQNGNPYPIAPVWSSTGGTIGANGFYVAGSIPGQYLITATYNSVVGGATVAINDVQRVGYQVPGSGYTNYRPPWSHSSFYTNNTWWVLAEDSSRGDDVFLWKWDGGTPQNPGGAGNFSVIPGVEPADRSSGRQTIWWDEASQKLVALEMHHSTSQYHEFVYDAGSDTWSAVVKDESPPIRGSSSNSLTALVIDSAGVSWYIEYETTTPRAWYRGGPSNWVQGATIDVAGNGGSSNTAIAAFTFRDDDGDSAIGIVYTSVSGWKFAWRKDLAPRNAPWTVESVTNLYTPDDHLGAMAYLPAGEVASAIVFAGKSGADQAFVAKRSSSGAWSVSGALTSDFSKVNMVLDETNEQVYVLGENKDARTDRKYIKVDLADLSVAPAVTFMQDDGASNDFSGSVGTPTHPVNANTELMLVSRGPSGTWWNILDIQIP